MQTPGISTEPQRRRRYTASFRQQVIEESLRNELSVARVAMKYGINANLLHTWRWHYRREQNPGVRQLKAQVIDFIDPDLKKCPYTTGKRVIFPASFGAFRPRPRSASCCAALIVPTPRTAGRFGSNLTW